MLRAMTCRPVYLVAAATSHDHQLHDSASSDNLTAIVERSNAVYAMIGRRDCFWSSIGPVTEE